MKNTKIIVILLLFLIGILALSLHIIDIAFIPVTKLAFYDIQINKTYYNTYRPNQNWFGLEVPYSFIYDLCLYTLIGCIAICIFLILKEVEVVEKND